MLPNIGLVGPKRVGKDTIAQRLVLCHGYVQVALADPVKDALLLLDPSIPTVTGSRRLSAIVDAEGWDSAKESYPELRRLLKVFATDVVRNMIEHDAWIRLAMEAVDKAHRNGKPVVVSDIRFPNEAQAFQQRGFILVGVQRPSVEPIDHHSSETSYRLIKCKHHIINDSTIETLHERVDALI